MLLHFSSTRPKLLLLCFRLFQMLSLNTFVISDDNDSNDLSEAESSGLELDQLDFFIDGYYVDERRFPVLGKALLKGKARAQEENEDL